MFDPNDFDDFDEALLFARATECGVEGCDGTLHDHLDVEENWTLHRVGHGALASGLQWDLIIDEGRAYAFVDGELDAAGVRALATTASETALLALADELDRRSA